MSGDLFSEGYLGVPGPLRALLDRGASDEELIRYLQNRKRDGQSLAHRIIRVPSTGKHARLGDETYLDGVLKRLIVHALKPVVNALEPNALFQYVMNVLHISEQLVKAHNDEAMWSTDESIAAASRIVMIFALDMSDQLAGEQKELVQDGYAENDASKVGLVPEYEFAARSNWSSKQLIRAIASQRVFFVEVEGIKKFPTFFLETQYSRRQLEAITRAMGGLHGGSKLQFFTSPKGSLGGITPLAALLRGKYQLVKSCAQAYAER